MLRIVVSENELIDWINSKLKTEDACIGCVVKGVIRLRDSNIDDCNWSSSVFLRCSENDSIRCHSLANTIIAEAQSLFNIQ